MTKMNIFKFFKKPQSRENFLMGILLKEKEGLILIFKRNEYKISLEFYERVLLTNGLDNLTEDLDLAFYKIDKKLGFEIKETIFFLYSHFLEEKNTRLKSETLTKIKNVVKNLDLKPLGYIEVIDCLSSYLTHQDKIPFTSVVMEIDKSYLDFFIYKGGKIFFKKIIKKSENIVEDIKNILNTKEEGFLIPTRMIIYDGRELDNYSIKIVNYPWSENYFIQTPKIEILKEEELLQALIFTLNQQFINQEKNHDKFLFGDQKIETKERYGFLIGKDIKEEEKKKLNENQKYYQNNQKVKLKINFNLLKDKIFYVFRKLPLNFLKNKLPPRLLIILVIFLFFLLIITNEYLFHKAEITLIFPKKTIDKKISFDLDYFISSTSSTIKVEKETTGKRIIGEKAKGEVIVYNTNLEKEKLIKKGTKITVDNLGFIFEEEIKIATAQSATNPGSATAKVIAEEIGEEYNIKKGKRFNIDENSYAQSIQDFSGGSKKEIRTVSSSDISKLEEMVVNEGKKTKVKEPAKNMILLNNLREIKIIEKEVSNEVGEEVGKVSMIAKILITDTFFNEKDLKTKIIKKVEPEAENGYKLNEQLITYKITLADIKNNKLNLEGDFKIDLIKNINTNQLRSQLILKKNFYLDKFFKENLKVINYHLKNENLIPFLEFYMPLFKKNIFIKISHN